MIYIILGSFVLIVMAGAFSLKWKYGGEYAEPHSFWASFGTAIFAGFLTSLASVMVWVIVESNNLTKVYTTTTEKQTLVALKDFSSQEGKLSGGFFLVVGVVQGSSQEVYQIRYATNSNGTIRIKTMKMDDRVGFVQDGKNELIITKEVTTIQYTDAGKKLFWDDKPNYGTKTTVISNIFHIPEGSITHEYKVDLE